MDKIYGLQTVEDKRSYIEALADYIAKRRITLEVCLTSNMQTLPELTDISQHPIREMLARNLSLSLCTDNRLVSNTSVCQEVKLAVDNFEFTPKKLLDTIACGFKRSFYYHPYLQKRRYVRKAINMYERAARDHGLEI